MKLTDAPVAKAGMLIRRPVAEVFTAFVDPAVTTRFWFTQGSGRLEPGRRVRWDWTMYGVSTDVEVQALEPNRRLVMTWGDEGKRSTVEWLFTARPDGSTFVSVTDSGFTGSGDEIVAQALDSAGGFALVLAGCKAWLEHGLDLRLVPDRFPDAHVTPRPAH